MLYRLAAIEVAALVTELEVQKLSSIHQASLNATANIVTNLHENGYIKLADLAYFVHKEIVE